jgi:hypothetical protein
VTLLKQRKWSVDHGGAGDGNRTPSLVGGLTETGSQVQPPVLYARCSVIGVRTKPGRTPSTRIPVPFNSQAKVSVNRAIPALATAKAKTWPIDRPAGKYSTDCRSGCQHRASQIDRDSLPPQVTTAEHSGAGPTPQPWALTDVSGLPPRD